MKVYLFFCGTYVKKSRVIQIEPKQLIIGCIVPNLVTAKFEECVVLLYNEHEFPPDIIEKYVI